MDAAEVEALKTVLNGLDDGLAILAAASIRQGPVRRVLTNARACCVETLGVRTLRLVEAPRTLPRVGQGTRHEAV